VAPRLKLLSDHRAQLSFTMSGYAYTRYDDAYNAVYYLGGFDKDLDAFVGGGESMGCGSPDVGKLRGHVLPLEHSTLPSINFPRVGTHGRSTSASATSTDKTRASGPTSRDPS
jgi:hypothetical protein